jgi:nitrogen fixation protein NifU and related proteins
MNDPLDEVQKQLFGNLREFYSETTTEHILRPRNVGSLNNPDGFASLHSICNESMEIWLKVRDNRIHEVGYWTDGCAATIACGSMVGELAKGKTVNQALSISPRDLAEALDDLPEGNFHCAELAANTLKAAVRDYLEVLKEPWKKAYRTR